MTKSKIALAIAAGLAASGVVAGPIVLPDKPLYIQYNNAEQTSTTNDIGNALNLTTFKPAAGTEGNWGIMSLTTIGGGVILPPTGSDIADNSDIFFANNILPAGAQILGMFYGATFTDPSGLQATGGSLDLYWWESGKPAQSTGAELANPANLAKRTAADEYTGFTCAAGNTATCTFLVHYDFVSGALPGSPTTTISSNNTPGTADGVSKSYLDVDPLYTNGLGQLGFWANALDTNFFTLDPLNNPVGHDYIGGGLGISFPAARDLRLDNNFTANGASAWGISTCLGGGPECSPTNTTDIVGLRSNDPARTASVTLVPEPGSLALLGLGLAGLAVAGRRRRTNA